jgi:CHAT domain-containing protein
MGVMGFAQHWKDFSQGGEGPFELWATLLGSGGSGIDAGQAAQMIAQGVWAANDLLQRISNWPVVASLHLVELYMDRASTALHALKSLEITQANRFSISKIVQMGQGGERRTLDMGYRGAGYDFISALTGAGTDSTSNNSTIHYTMDTRRARTEMRAQSSQRRLVEQLVAQASNGNSTDHTIGHTLFKLLVPLEMEAALGGTSTLVLELDQGSAPIPWEMLDTESGSLLAGDHMPWAIRTKLIRKLKLEDFRQQPRDASLSNGVLVIGEPHCGAPRLPGARREARAVGEKLRSHLGEDQVDCLIAPEEREAMGPKAAEIINKLLERHWRIVHISGHGMPAEGNDPRGVVLSDDLYLGAREIKTMRVVPELVFVNCCHLAATNEERLLDKPYNRAKFAASVAEQLIHNGVRCVVAAGWAVSDAGAELFATRFYDELLRGQRFIDAIATARLAVFENAGVGDNTWAAYQCYGDPDWLLKRDGEDPQGEQSKAPDLSVGVVSPSALTLALDSLSNRARFAKMGPSGQLQDLESRFAKQWGHHGEVAHAFGMAWEQANNFEKAIEWYEKALKAEDGGATLKSWERLANLKPRLAWKQLQKANDERLKAQRDLGQEEAERQWQDEIAKARETILAATERLQSLIERGGATMERHNLCGAAQKRLVMVERQAGNKESETKALKDMKESYEQAEKIGTQKNLQDLFYPGLNKMAAECVLHAGTDGLKQFEDATITRLRNMLEKKSDEDPDFWSEVGLVELNLYSALANQGLQAQLPSIQKGYEALHQKEQDPIKWGSVLDQLDFVLPAYIEHIKASKPKEVEAAQTLSALVGAYLRPN